MFKKVAKRALRAAGLRIVRYTPEEPVHYLPVELMPEDPIATLAIVGTPTGGYRGTGKGDPALFFPIFMYHLAQMGIASDLYPTAGHLLAGGRKPDAILPIYSEEHASTEQSMRDLKPIETAYPDALLFNRPALGRLLANKREAHSFYLQRGIPTPAPFTNSVASSRAFSLAPVGTHLPAALVEPGAVLAPGRHNTEFIDTRVEFEGTEYYVVLRALCVGETMVAAYARARPVIDGDPSVHNADTPLNPPFLAWLHQHAVEANRSRLVSLCADLGRTLGPGTFAHDILPASDGRLLVCESGFKFEDQSLRKHLWPISTELPFLTDVIGSSFAARSAAAVAKHILNKQA